jgi:hypothetical protein
MKTLSRFISKFTSSIAAVLSCFDRVIFKGHLALSAPCELEYFVDCILKVRRSDFMKTMAPQDSDRLIEHARITFVDPGGAEAPGECSARIDWDDGSTTTGAFVYNAATRVFTITEPSEEAPGFSRGEESRGFSSD